MVLLTIERIIRSPNDIISLNKGTVTQTKIYSQPNADLCSPLFELRKKREYILKIYSESIEEALGMCLLIH